MVTRSAGAQTSAMNYHPGELQWKSQQKTLWAEVRRATGNGKNRVKIRDLLADERCTRPILDFLHTTAGARAEPPLAGAGGFALSTGVGQAAGTSRSEMQTMILAYSVFSSSSTLTTLPDGLSLDYLPLLHSSNIDTCTYVVYTHSLGADEGGMRREGLFVGKINK